MFKMDLAKFKKISSDKHSTVMQHEDGHSLKIAHAALTPRMREQLASIPVHEDDSNPDPTQRHLMPGDKEQNKIEKQVVNRAKGKLKMAEGGEAKNPKDDVPEPNPVAAAQVQKGATSHGTTLSEGVENLKKSLGFAEGGETPQVSAEEDAIEPFNPINTITDAAKFVGQKISDSMSADSAAFEQARLAQEQGNPAPMQDWMTRHAMNMAMGTLGAPDASGPGVPIPEVPGKALPFHEQAAMIKSAESAAREVPMKPTASQVSSIDQGLISGPEYTAKVQALTKKPEPQKMAVGGEADVNSSRMPGPDELNDLPTMTPGQEAIANKMDYLKSSLPGVYINQPEKLQQDAAAQVASETPPQLQPPTVQVASPELAKMPATQPAVQQEPAQVGQASQQAAEDQMPSLAGGYQQQLQGIGEEAQAKAHLGEAQAKLFEDQLVQQKETQDRFKNEYQALQDERQGFLKDIQNNHVDPQNYWKDHSKLLTGLGIILAGFNPTNRPNAAIEFLNHQMDQNLQAQAQNLTSKNNLLAANMHQFGNMKDAIAMTRIMQHDMLSAKLDQEAAKATDPMAKARALQLKGQLQMQTTPQFMEMALRRSMMQAATPANGGQPAPEQMISYLRVLKPDMAKEMESRLVPGLNGGRSELASIPVPEAAREKLVAKQQLANMAKDLYNWSEQHSGEVDPRIVSQGKTKAAELQSLYRNSINGGVFKKGEQEFIDNIVESDPTKFFNKLRGLPALKEVIRSNDHQLNTLRQSYGLSPINPTDSLSPAQKNDYALAQHRLKANPNDEIAKKVLKHLGVE